MHRPTDPASVKIFDPEFSEDANQVAWIDDSGYTTKVRVADIDGSGDFVNPDIADESVDILNGSANLKNGPEWVHNYASPWSGILYSKLVDSVATIHVAHDHNNDENWTVISLGVAGRSPVGTLATTSVSGGAVMFIDGSSLFGYHHYYCELLDCANTDVQAWPLSLTPPDLMRFAEVNDAYAAPTLVGVDYTYYFGGSNPDPLPVFQWVDGGSPAVLVDDAPTKFKGWKWYSPEADEVLVLTSDQMFPSPRTGPGQIKIYKTNGDLWQVIPAGRNDYPYIGSIEPFVDHDDPGVSWIIFAASQGTYPNEDLPTRVIMARVSDEAVGGDGIDPTLTIRQVDAAPDGDEKHWKDPEGYHDGSTSWVYMTGWNQELSIDDYDTVRCVTGI